MSTTSSANTDSSAPDQRQQHIFVGIEGLRGVAAVAVMCAHVILIGGALKFPRIVNHAVFLGLNGVTLFFCLSGFLLYAPFVRAVFGEPRPDVPSFYVRRIFRIYPAYLVILVLTWMAGAWIIRPPTMGEGSLGPIGRSHDVWSIFSNVTLLQGYTPSTVLSGLSVSWSLVPEVAFYAVLPLLGALAYVLRQRGLPSWVAAAAPAGIMVLGGLVMRFIADHLITHGSGGIAGATFREDGASWVAVLRCSFPASADLFGLGMVAALLVTLAGNNVSARGKVVRLTAIIAVISLLGVAVDQDHHQSAPIIGLFAASAITLISLRHQSRLVRAASAVLSSRPVDYLGRISYSIYLLHFPILLFVVDHSGSATTYGGFALRSAEIIGATLVLSALSYHFVEAPSQRLARSLNTRRRAKLALSASQPRMVCTRGGEGL